MKFFWTWMSWRFLKASPTLSYSASKLHHKDWETAKELVLVSYEYILYAAYLCIFTKFSLSLSICLFMGLSFLPACQKHRHICAPFTTVEVYLTRKLPSSCLTYLQYCHHQIFICRAEDLWVAKFLLLCSIYTTFCMRAQTHICTQPRLDVFMRAFHTLI